GHSGDNQLGAFGRTVGLPDTLAGEDVDHLFTLGLLLTGPGPPNHLGCALGLDAVFQQGEVAVGAHAMEAAVVYEQDVAKGANGRVDTGIAPRSAYGHRPRPNLQEARFGDADVTATPHATFGYRRRVEGWV